jgi:hypothetical protein
MKAYQITLFIFFFNMMVAMYSQVPIFGSYGYENLTVTEGVMVYGLDNRSNVTSVSLAYDSEFLNVTSGFEGYSPTDRGDIGMLEGIVMVFEAFANATVLLPFFLENLGVPTLLRLPLTAGSWFAYIVGLVQFLLGSGWETMK